MLTICENLARWLLWNLLLFTQLNKSLSLFHAKRNRKKERTQLPSQYSFHWTTSLPGVWKLKTFEAEQLTRWYKGCRTVLGLLNLI